MPPHPPRRRRPPNPRLPHPLPSAPGSRLRGRMQRSDTVQRRRGPLSHAPPLPVWMKAGPSNRLRRFHLPEPPPSRGELALGAGIPEDSLLVLTTSRNDVLAATPQPLDPILFETWPWSAGCFLPGSGSRRLPRSSPVPRNPSSPPRAGERSLHRHAHEAPDGGVGGGGGGYDPAAAGLRSGGLTPHRRTGGQ